MRKIATFVLALIAALPLHAQTFNLFKPANGILKGQTTTYVTTAAASSDVISLWSGTCNSSSFLRGDGSCQSPGSGTPGGSNTQLQYNNSGSFGGTSGLTWDGAKLTTPASASGSAGLNLPQGSAPSSPVNGDLWTTSSGLFARINGGTVGPFGAGGGTPGGSDTQVQYNSSGSFAGSAAFTWNDTTHTLLFGTQATAPTLGTIVSATTGTAMTVYAGDCSGANCTAGTLTIRGGQGTSSSSTNGGGLILRGGNADTGNRAGGIAQLLGGAGTGLNDGGIVTVAGGNAGGTGGGGGLNLKSGTGSAGAGNIVMTTGNTDRITLTGTNSSSTGVKFNGYGLGVLASDSSGNITANGGFSSGNFTVSWDDACTTTSTQTVYYTIVGKVVTLATTGSVSCTSDSVAFQTTGTPVPAAIRPTIAQIYVVPSGARAFDNGAYTDSSIRVDTSGNLSVGTCGTASTCTGGWTNTGNKQLGRWTGTYIIDSL